MRIGQDLQQAKSDLYILSNFIQDIKDGKAYMDLELVERLTSGAKKAVDLADEKRHQIECMLR